MDPRGGGGPRVSVWGTQGGFVFQYDVITDDADVIKLDARANQESSFFA